MNYYNKIKDELINKEVYCKVKDYSKNNYELETYYKIGKLLIEAQGGTSRAKYGDNLIKEYSLKLVKEVGKKYDVTMLKRIRQFYLLIEKGAPLGHQLTWSHYRELLPIKDLNEIIYYINICISKNLTKRELINKIKSKEYERLDENAKKKIINKEKLSIKDEIKHPIIIKNKYNTEDITEKMLKGLIIENIETFLKELGTGFCYIESEYKIKIGTNYNYIDILLFNIKYNCYVVIELKVTILKKEHIGQIETYMNYIDKNLKTIYQDKTIGIIITKKNNLFIIEYCSDPRIYNTTYELV